MLLFVCAPTTITEPPGGGGPLTSASNARLAFLGFCGLEPSSLPNPDGSLTAELDRKMLAGLVVAGQTQSPLTAASVSRLRWMDFCGFEQTTMRPDGTLSVNDSYHFLGLVPDLGTGDDDRLLLLGVS